jgi:translation initiation factor 1
VGGAGKSRRTEGEGWVFRPAGETDSAARSQRPSSRPEPPAEPPTVRLRIEKRRGKPVTVGASSGIAEARLRDIVRELKDACAAGGTLSGRDFEIQGDQREKVRGILERSGIRVKG